MKEKSVVKDLISQGAIWYARKPEFNDKISHSYFHSETVSDSHLESPFRLFSPAGIHEISLELSELTPSPLGWAPPLQFTVKVLEHLISTNKTPEKSFIVWISKKCWPSSFLLSQLSANINFSTKISHLFIDAKNKNKRQMAAIHNLRSNFVLAVICDGSGFKFVETRKLQLAANKGTSLGIIIKPPWEQEVASAAITKWKVKPTPTTMETFNWQLTLTKARGLLEEKNWKIELNTNLYEKDSLYIFTDTSRRPKKTETVEIQKFAA